MNFEDLDTRMRVFETAHDHVVLPGLFMVARLDGRSFTKLTKEQHDFEAPYDERFRDLMVSTVEHLLNCGFHPFYGYTQSDEISLAFHQDENGFGRKLRKMISVLAGEASSVFSVRLGSPGVFDCRISQLPSEQDVMDYFRWRAEDAHRNALNAHCYWLLRKQGQNAKKATEQLLGLSVSRKNEMLFQLGNVNFNDLPVWQRRGIGVYWEIYEKEGVDPRTGEKTTAIRRRVKQDLNLPMGEAYQSFLAELLRKESSNLNP